MHFRCAQTTQLIFLQLAAFAFIQTRCDAALLQPHQPGTGKLCNLTFSCPYDVKRHEDTIPTQPRKQEVRYNLCAEKPSVGLTHPALSCLPPGRRVPRQASSARGSQYLIRQFLGILLGSGRTTAMRCGRRLARGATTLEWTSGEESSGSAPRPFFECGRPL